MPRVEQYDAQIVASLGLALRVQRYSYGEVLQILKASEALGAGILFYWWEPSGVVSRQVCQPPCTYRARPPMHICHAQLHIQPPCRRTSAWS